MGGGSLQAKCSKESRGCPPGGGGRKGAAPIENAIFDGHKIHNFIPHLGLKLLNTHTE